MRNTRRNETINTRQNETKVLEYWGRGNFTS